MMSHRIGSVCYATEQGLGHLAKSFFGAGVITDPLLFMHSHHQNHTEWYPPGTPKIHGRPFDPQRFTYFDAVLFFETPFDWSILPKLRDRNIKTVLVPMHEWTPKNPPHWFDKVISPSLLDLKYFPESTFLPIPVDPSTWRQRTKAVKFLHNAGHIGHREHKGTRQLLEALQFVKSDLRLHVRCQDTMPFNEIVRGMPWLYRNGEVVDRRVTFNMASVYREDLFGIEHDVYIAPEKFNGLSLPLQEAWAAGMAVMTSDRFPHNTWLPREPLIPVSGYRRACVGQQYLEFDEAIVRPEDVAAAMDRMFGQDLCELSLAGKAWAEANCWATLKDKWLEAILK
jgi:glycosyltransferase involved in cell wall biosynthesis